jgi:hypothetical protein
MSFARSHQANKQGHMNGRTPYQAFTDGIKLVEQEETPAS